MSATETTSAAKTEPTRDRTAQAPAAPRSLEGGCACRAVRWRVAENTPMGPTVACHCRQCNQASSHYLAAATVKETGLSWTETAGLRWFQSSDFAERGFCGTCGTALAWRLSDPEARVTVALMAGSFDDQSVLSLDRHIFVAHKAPYYEITDALPQHADAD